jgi:hypothetical protein
MTRTPANSLLLSPEEKDQRKFVTAINQSLKGKINSVGTVTLNAGAAATTVNNPLVGHASVIMFAAQTPNAAAIAVPYVKLADITEGTSFIITHANDANADKQFSYVILG